MDDVPLARLLDSASGRPLACLCPDARSHPFQETYLGSHHISCCGWVWISGAGASLGLTWSLWRCSFLEQSEMSQDFSGVVTCAWLL